ncbi:MAG: amidase [Actinomycetota bacterium]|nr:amidase [Actinomycetota bacterium]
MLDRALSRSALDQAAAVRAGEVSSRELVEEALAAIERLDGDLNAFITVTAERALAEADAIRPGDERPLAGVPIAVKDTLALVEGVRTTFGAGAMADWVAPVDSALVRRLRGAGAVLIGKTNLPELGILPVTEPRAYGPTRNPWDTMRTPGGSSGGSGAAVAAGMVAVAHGNDGGGSIRIPASCCGLVGLKPTRGRSSVAPVSNDALDIVADGSLTWTVADTALVLDVISGYEHGDPYWAPEPSAPFLEAARRPPGRLRIGFTHQAPNGVPVHPDCRAAVEDAARLLESLGHEVEEEAPAWDDEAFAERFVATWLTGVPTRVESLGLARGRPIDPEELEPLTRAMNEVGARISAGDYIAAHDYLRLAARRIVASMAGRDVLLTPTLAQPPLEIGALDPQSGESPLSMLERSARFIPFTPTWNVTGQPAISLPLSASDDGLPIGVQLVGPPAGEELLLSLGAELEAARPWNGRRPPVFAG